MKKIFLFFCFVLTIFLYNPISGMEFFSPSDTSVNQSESIIKKLYSDIEKESNLGRYDEAIKIYRNVIQLLENYSALDSVRLVKNYLNFSGLLVSSWKFDDANYYLDKALEIVNKNEIELYNKVLIYKVLSLLRTNEFETSMRYLNQIEKNIRFEKSKGEAIREYIFRYKISILSGTGKYEEAIVNLNKFLNDHPNSNLEKEGILIMKLNFMYLAKKNEAAIELYNEYRKMPGTDRFKITLDLQYGTLIYYNLNRIDEAIEVFEKAEKQLAGKKDLTDLELSCFNNLANCYVYKKQFKKALDYYQKALIVQYPGFTETDIKKSPPSEILYQEAVNLPLFANKAEVLLYYSQETGDTSYLRYSLDNFLRSINIIQQMRLRITSEQSQFLISKKDAVKFSLAQYVAMEMFHKTKNKKFLDIAFEINEKGKSFTLLSNLRGQKAMEFSDIPARLKNKEAELTRQVSLYDELLFKERHAANPDKAKISAWEDFSFNANLEYSLLLKKFEREYPDYYQLKYNQKVNTLSDVKSKISRNTVMLEYSITDSVILIYTASRGNIDVTKVNIEKGFEDRCVGFLNLITTQDFSKNVTETYNKYTYEAYNLYKILIEPVKDKIKGNNLIIIPDGALSYIPFDALLTASVAVGKPDYRHAPYLIRDYSVGYSYSSTMHFTKQKQVILADQTILAFAPIYGSGLDESDIPKADRQPEQLDLAFLPGVALEVHNIASMLKTDAFYNAKAKESVFKEKAPKYKILHLAMHAKIDNNDPMLSRLLFTQLTDGDEDASLYTFEIYNLKLHADLAVLSSCSSGYGKIQPGEGVQSLARGFAYAGCPSILMTLWEVGDFSTSFIMTEFYKYMKGHRTKPVSLREAKINFLAKADELRSNPYFWAPYVVIGDSSPIFDYKEHLAPIAGALLIVPIGFLGFSYRKYKKDSKKERKRVSLFHPPSRSAAEGSKGVV